MTTIIEPCCAERQLPALLREQKGRAVLFQTYGDVKLTAMTKAVSGMTGRGHRMTLAVPQVTKETLQFAAKGIRLGTMTALRLITRDDQSALIREHLAALTSAAPASAAVPVASASGPASAPAVAAVPPASPIIDYAIDPALAFSLLMFDGPQGVVILQGDILQAVTPALRLYAGQFATDPAAIKPITATIDALFRARRAPAAVPEAAVPEASASGSAPAVPTATPEASASGSPAAPADNKKPRKTKK